MKTPASRTPSAVAPSVEPQPKRRQLVVGAGVAAGAALAAAAAVRHGSALLPAEVAKAGPETAEAQGYRLTDHVLRYYETTRS